MVGQEQTLVVGGARANHGDPVGEIGFGSFGNGRGSFLMLLEISMNSRFGNILGYIICTKRGFLGGFPVCLDIWYKFVWGSLKKKKKNEVGAAYSCGIEKMRTW